jgi:translation elongation factor EF-1alpha
LEHLSGMWLDDNAPAPSAVLQREAAATGKASFAWAWMLDERPEERACGVTVDVATTR